MIICEHAIAVMWFVFALFGRWAGAGTPNGPAHQPARQEDLPRQIHSPIRIRPPPLDAWD